MHESSLETDWCRVVYQGNGPDSYSQWLRARKNIPGVGSTDISVIMGVNRYLSRFGLWQERNGGRRRRETPGMSWGRRLQDAIATAYFEKSDRKPLPLGHLLLQSKEWPIHFSSPDVIWEDPSGNRGVLEVKTAAPDDLGDWANGAVPMMYLCQLQHQLMVTGFDRGAICCLVGGRTFIDAGTFQVDLQLQAGMRSAAASFMETLRERTCPFPPDPEVGASAGTTSSSVMGEEPAAVTLPDHAVRWHAYYQRALEDERRARSMRTGYEDMLVRAIGKARCGLLPDGSRYEAVQQGTEPEHPDAYHAPKLRHINEGRVPER